MTRASGDRRGGLGSNGSSGETNLLFGRYSHYYDLLYAEKDDAAEAAYVIGLLGRCGLPSGDLLEFGCGTGRHACQFAAAGYRVTGVERSPGMLARARSCPGFTLVGRDIRDLRLGRHFHAVVALFHVLSYQIENADVVATLASAAAHLEPGGLFLFDVWYSPAVLTLRPQVRVQRVADKRLALTRLAEPKVFANENRVDVRYTLYAQDRKTGAVEVVEETHPMRHFSLPELDLFAAAAGFERVLCEAFLTGEPPGETTWGLCLVLRRV